MVWARGAVPGLGSPNLPLLVRDTAVAISEPPLLLADPAPVAEALIMGCWEQPDKCFGVRRNGKW